MEKDKIWYEYLNLFGILSVVELSLNLVRELCSKDPDNETTYNFAYRYLQDRPLSPKELQVSKIEARSKLESQRRQYSDSRVRAYREGEWGRPTNIEDTVGWAKANVDGFARQVTENLNENSWLGNNSRYRKQGS